MPGVESLSLRAGGSVEATGEVEDFSLGAECSELSTEATGVTGIVDSALGELFTEPRAGATRMEGFSSRDECNESFMAAIGGGGVVKVGSLSRKAVGAEGAPAGCRWARVVCTVGSSSSRVSKSSSVSESGSGSQSGRSAEPCALTLCCCCSWVEVDADGTWGEVSYGL